VEQTYRPRELLIINDGEERVGLEADNIREIRIEKVTERTLGDLRNLALELAYGEWVIQWDDDDWYAPDRIERQMRAMRPGVAVFLGDIIHYSISRNSAFFRDFTQRGDFPKSMKIRLAVRWIDCRKLAGFVGVVRTHAQEGINSGQLRGYNCRKRGEAIVRAKPWRLGTQVVQS
jgi:glycosyltransferase involved in cell wall biosynthesis